MSEKNIKFGHNDDDVIGPLCIKLPLMVGYAKHFSNSNNNNNNK